LISKLTSKIKQNNNSFIAVVTSVAGLRGRQKNFFYGSAKSGMISFLSGLRQKFSGKINVLTIIPGYIKTEKLNIDAPALLVTSPEKTARIINEAIKNKKEVIYINFLWRVIMFFLVLIPEKIFKNFKF
jgi:short-subunit dehydrogenase